MELREALRAPRLDPERTERLVEICNQIVNRVVDGRDAARLIYAFNRDVGRVFGPTTFRGVFGSEECDEFVDRILTRVPDELPPISDEEAEEMVRRIQSGEVDDRESWYWVRLLAEHYDQPRFSDLVYWPSRDLRPDEIVSAARLDDDAIEEFLDPMAWGAPERSDDVTSPTQRYLARRVLQELSRLALLEVVDDAEAIDLIAPLFAETSDAAELASALAARLARTHAASEPAAEVARVAQVIRSVRAEVS